MKTSTILAALVFLTAVSSAEAATSPAADIELVRDASQVASCERLGEVAAKSSLGGMFTQVTYNRMLREFKAKAADLGGTHILVVDMASGFTGTRLLGNAYRCGAAPFAGQ